MFAKVLWIHTEIDALHIPGAMPSRYSYDDMGGEASGTSNPFASFSNASSNKSASQEEPKKPCRACTDFKTWRKQQSISVSSKSE